MNYIYYKFRYVSQIYENFLTKSSQVVQIVYYYIEINEQKKYESHVNFWNKTTFYFIVMWWQPSSFDQFGW